MNLPNRPYRMSAAVAVAAVLTAGAVLAAGCGSDGGDSSSGAGSSTDQSADGSELGGSSTTSSDEGDPSADIAAAERSVTAYSDCMRNKGVDLPDLGVDSDGDLAVGDLLSGLDTQDPATQTAILACQGELDAALGGQLTQMLESGTAEDALTAFSQCVRDGGYDVPDLTFATLIGGALEVGTATDPRGTGNAVAPLLAEALGLDSQDVDVLDKIDGCASLVEASLGDLGIG